MNEIAKRLVNALVLGASGAILCAIVVVLVIGLLGTYRSAVERG
jgi:hypothetical protein